MEHVWTVLCRRAITDRETNQTSLIDSIEGLTATISAEKVKEAERDNKRIGVEVGAVLVSFWVRSDLKIPEMGEMRTRVVAPDGSVVSREDAKASVNLRDNRRMRMHLEIPALPFAGEGQYWFVTEMLRDEQWLLVSRVPCEMNLQDAESEIEKQAPPPGSPKKKTSKR